MSVLATHRSPTYSFFKYPQTSITLLQGLGVEGDIHAGKKARHQIFIELDKKKGVLRDNIRQVHLIQSELFDEEGICAKNGTRLRPGQMGENITTVGIDLLALGKGTKLHFLKSVDDNANVQDQPNTKVALVVRLLLAIAVIITVVAAILQRARVWSFAGVIALMALVGLYFTPYGIKTSQDGTAVVELTGRRRPCKKIDENVCPGLKEKCTITDENRKITGHKAGVMGIVRGRGVVKAGMHVKIEPAEVFEELAAI